MILGHTSTKIASCNEDHALTFHAIRNVCLCQPFAANEGKFTDVLPAIGVC